MFTLLLSAFPAALLGLTCFVIKRQRINLVWELDRYLGNQGYRKLIKPVRAINRAFTPRERMEREIKFIRDWAQKRKEMERVLQREIYLLQEKDALDAARRDSLSADEKTASLSKIEGDLGQIKPQLWKNAQDLVGIRSRPEHGSWILEFMLPSVSHFDTILPFVDPFVQPRADQLHEQHVDNPQSHSETPVTNHHECVNSMSMQNPPSDPQPPSPRGEFDKGQTRQWVLCSKEEQEDFEWPMVAVPDSHGCQSVIKKCVLAKCAL